MDLDVKRGLPDKCPVIQISSFVSACASVLVVLSACQRPAYKTVNSSKSVTVAIVEKDANRMAAYKQPSVHLCE